ncbi:MAG: hypothetical protein IKP98_01980 [Bacilli bacterium]|nr:hypothetical protein [Bacilli bacterium]
MGKDNKMNNLVMNKKQMLVLALAFTMGLTGLTGCKKNVETSQTTLATTAITTVGTSATETTEVNFVEETTKLYEANKDFFINQYGDNKDLAIKEINNTILVLTNNSKTITNEDLRNTFYAMEGYFMPANVIQGAGNYITGETVKHIDNVPDLSVFIQEEEAQALVRDNTIAINNFIDKLNNGTEEEKAQAKKLLLQRVVVIEDDLDEKYHLGELSNGDELAINMSNKGLVNLAGSLVKNGYLYYTDKNGVDQVKPLIPDMRAAAIIDAYVFGEQDGIPYDTKEIDGVTVNGRFVEYLGADGFVREFVSQTEYKSIRDAIAVIKYDETITRMENEYSRISSEYYALNGDCNTKTLTK